MNNKLLRNDTDVYYTVRIKNGLYISRAERNNGIISSVSAQASERNAVRYSRKDLAMSVAQYVEGTVTKHTMTEVVTVISEDIPVEIEDEDEEEPFE